MSATAGGAVAAVAACAVLVSGTAVSLLLAARVAWAEGEARASAKRAQAEAAVAREVGHFWQEVVAQASPW